MKCVAELQFFDAFILRDDMRVRLLKRIRKKRGIDVSVNCGVIVGEHHGPTSPHLE
jgi:hypothetical protein